MDLPLAECPLIPGAGAVSNDPATQSGPQGNAITSAVLNPSEPTKGTKPSIFSWLEPHPALVVILVGSDKIPFVLQKDLLCAKSSYYSEKLANGDDLEYSKQLPDCPVEVFSFIQNFMYTGAVIPDDNTLPSYEILIGVWKLGQELRIGSLCDHTLDAMVKVRLATTRIPAAPLMVQVWKDTPAGCSVRKLLLSWAAEYMHTSDSKAQFAKSLPQDVLSELVLAMVPLYTSRLAQLSGFWARLVVPFKEPVHPVIDNVPDYFEKVTKPMDLHTMKSKMDKKRYTNNEEFLADMNQIFANCKAYWKPTDNVYAACEKLEKTFLKQYSKMNKWLAKLEGEEN